MNFKSHYFNESINDKPLFKCIFTAGGPGSGKSFISETMFRGENVMFINSDAFFEHLLKKNDLPFDIDSKNKIVYVKQQEQREIAKTLSKHKLGNTINGMLSMIIDGTGKNYKKIEEQYNIIKSLGYDCYMIFVNTSFEVALERNSKRERKVDRDIVKNFWQEVQNNLGKFQDLFGDSNFTIVDNSEVLVGTAFNKFQLDLVRKAKKLLHSPLKNPVGINTIETLKKVKGKYFSDLTGDRLSKYNIEV